MSHATEDRSSEPTLGTVLKQARLAAGLTVRGLAEQSGVSYPQLSKLENDRIKTVNPAHLAALAEPLGVSIYTLYAAAGYGSPSALAALEPDLAAKLSKLPPAALSRLSAYVDRLVREHGDAGGRIYDLEQAGDV